MYPAPLSTLHRSPNRLEYASAAFSAIHNGGDIAAIKDAAHRFCGSSDHIYGRIAPIVVDLDDRPDHAAQLSHFMKACDMPRWQDLKPGYKWPVVVTQPIAISSIVRGFEWYVVDF